MIQEALIADRIRRGQGPDPVAVHDIATADAARLGETGVESARAVLASEVLGLGPLESCVADRARMPGSRSSGALAAVAAALLSAEPSGDPFVQQLGA